MCIRDRTDADLNTNPDIIDIYSVVSSAEDVAMDMVGKANYGQNSVGDNNGRMLDVTFDDEIWLKSTSGAGAGGATCSSTPGGGDGLGGSGFTLVETSKDSGVFTGDFQIPAEYCARSSGSGVVTSVMGTDIEVNLSLIHI